MRSVLISIVFAREVRAQTSFDPNCTLPRNIVNFVSSSSVRGTLDILWSALFTILICTWTVQHLNVPEQTPDCLKWQDTVKESLKRGGTRIKWMLITLIVPEFLVGRAFQDFMMARKSEHQMKEFDETNHVKWTRTHFYYANMDGFLLKVGSPYTSHYAEQDTPSNRQSQIMSPSGLMNSDDEHDAVAKSGRVVQDRQITEAPPPSLLPTEERNTTEEEQVAVRAEITRPVNVGTSVTRSGNISTSQSNSELGKIQYAYPNAHQLYLLRKAGIIEQLPEVPKKEIKDKSKGDAFIKATAVLQVLWIVVQVIARGVKGLPISQLEIAVIAFAACALLTYSFSWSKPQNVTVANLACNETIPLEQIREIERAGSTMHGGSWFRNLIQGPSANILKPIPNDVKFDSLPGSNILTFLDIGMGISGTLFGAVHIIAWRFHFPTPLEALLWRVASVYLAAVLPFCYSMAFLFEGFGWLEGVFDSRGSLSTLVYVLVKIRIALLLLSYILARLCLLVVVFRCLCFSDPEIFITTWVKEVPHLQ